MPEAETDEEVLEGMAEEVLARVREPGGKKWLKRGVIGVVVVGLIVAWFSSSQQRKNRPKWEFITTPVDRGDIIVAATATGTIEPRRTVTVGAEISGQIATVEVDDNDKVTTGQVLARFDAESLTTSLAQARAALRTARANVRRGRAGLDEAELEEKRLAPLVAKKVIASNQLDRARTNVIRAQADLSSSQAELERQLRQVELTEKNVEKGVIVSPIDGVVLKRSIEPGATVAASFQAPELFVLAEDLTKMELHVAVDEADIGRIKAGLAATFTVDAWPDRTFDADVLEVSLYPTKVDNVVTYDTVLAAENADGALRPGMTATARIIIGQSEQVLRVPNASLRWRPPSEESGAMFGPPGKASTTHRTNTVWLLQDGEPTEREFDPGATDGRFTQVAGDALNEGDPVITSTRPYTRKR